MLDVAIVLGADELEDFFVRQVGDAFLGPRFRQNARVVDRNFDFQMAEIGAMVTLDNVQLIGVRMRFDVEPDSRVEPHAIDDQGVTIPAADGMPIPGRVWIGGMAAAVQIDLMEAGTLVIGNVDQKILALDELPQRTVAQRGGGQAARLRTVLLIIFDALFLNGQRRGKKLRLAGIHRTRLPPDAGEIGLAIVSARRGTRGRSVPLVVRGYQQAVFTQGIELRGVAQAYVETKG